MTQFQTMDDIALPDKTWKASLNLELTRRNDRTVISHRRHLGPLQVQKPFYPEGPVCHIYLLHPPGGIVSGDNLMLDIHVQANAHGLVTTPAAGKFYRSDGRNASQQINLSIDDLGTMEWFPQETILFDASRAISKTHILLGDQAKFIGWEITCFGRPAANEQYCNGSYRQQFELWRNDKPLLLDRTQLQGHDDILKATWGLNGYTVMATLVATPVDNQTLAKTRAGMAPSDNALLSFTLIDDVLICRYLGQQAEIAKHALTEVWKIIRPAIMQRSACIPRIWAT